MRDTGKTTRLKDTVNSENTKVQPTKDNGWKTKSMERAKRGGPTVPPSKACISSDISKDLES